MDELTDAIRAQFVADVIEWLEWLDDEYGDADVPTDREMAQSIVDLFCDPRLMIPVTEMPDDLFREMRDLYEDNDLLLLMIGREAMSMRGESFARPLIPPSGSPEGMHR